MTLLEAVTHALGIELQELGGLPVVAVAKDFTPIHTTLYVSTTLGLQDTGWVWCGGLLLRYTARDDATATLTVPLIYRPRTLARGLRVVSAVKELRPRGYELFWSMSPNTKDHYDTWGS